MKRNIRSLLRSSGYRYLTVGGTVYVLELVVILIAQKQGLSDVAAVAWSFWTGLIVSFCLQKLVTFGDKRTHHKILIPQVLAFSLLVGFNFGFTLLMTRLLASTLPAVVIRTLAIGMTTIWNFYLYRTRIFKSDDLPLY